MPQPSGYNDGNHYFIWKIMRKIVKVEELEMVGAGATLQEWIDHNPGKPYQDLGYVDVTYKTQYGTATYKEHRLNVLELHENYKGQMVNGWHVIDINWINYSA